MNIFKSKTTWTNAELYSFKIGVFAAGILFGVYAKDFFWPYLNLVWLLAVAGCSCAAYFWILKVKK